MNIFSGLLPVMRVNYTIGQLFQSLFVSEKRNKYRKRLVSSISDFFSVDNIMLTSSGRCAIYMIVRSLPQKKVILPAYTCEVAVEAVKLTGKEIIFANVDSDSLNVVKYPEIDSDTIVIATHQYGLPCDVEQIVLLCKEKGAVLIEDCAGSLGSKVNGRLTGTFGDYSIFSFSASKTVQSPTRGGFIIAKNAELLRKILPLPKWKESVVKFKLSQIIKGFAFCLNKHAFFSNIIMHFQSSSKHDVSFENDPTYKRGYYEWQAFVVLKQFVKLDRTMSERKRLFELYNSQIDNIKIKKPLYNSDSVNIRYAIQLKDRKLLIEGCNSKGICVGLGYNKLYCPNDFSNEHLISQQIVYLPFGNHYSYNEIKKVISIVNSL